MNVVNHGRAWDDGGPTVFHSEWWIREHWGRAFDVDSVEERGVMLGPQWNGQGVVVLRKRDDRDHGRGGSSGSTQATCESSRRSGTTSASFITSH